MLSNNHVLANSNAAKKGDAILQPGSADGGSKTVARLECFIPIQMKEDVFQRLHFLIYISRE